MTTELQIRWFPAQWPGTCAACREKFTVDDEIGFLINGDRGVMEASGRLAGRECCGGTGKIQESSEVDFVPNIESLMPRGKSKKDACPDCFIIHATNQTECY